MMIYVKRGSSKGSLYMSRRIYGEKPAAAPELIGGYSF